MDFDRAKRAQALLNDADVKAALDAIEEGLIKSWRSAPATEDRERIWHDMRALDALRDKLKSFASDLAFAPKGDGR